MNALPAHVLKLWNCCNILRNDSLSYGDSVEQLTFLLFPKMGILTNATVPFARQFQ